MFLSNSGRRLLATAFMGLLALAFVVGVLGSNPALVEQLRRTSEALLGFGGDNADTAIEMIVIGVGTLLVVVVTLVVAVLALRHARRTGELAEKLAEHQLEDRESLEIIRGLRQGLDWERQECQTLREELDQERRERQRAQQALIQAQKRAENAEQKAMTEATSQLRARMDDYLKELGEAGTSC